MQFTKKVFAVVSFSLIATGFVYAQPSSTSTNSVPSSTETKITVVAGINVTDVNISEKDGPLIRGTFSLQGTMGQQNDIVFGIIVKNEAGKILDIMKLGSLPFLKEGELKSFPIVYSYPAYLSGKVKAIIYAETLKGLPLGEQTLYEGNRVGKGNGIECQPSKDAVTCTSLANATITVAYYSGGFFGMKLNEETKEALAGKSVSFDTKPLQAGSYLAIARDASGSGFASARIVKEGSFGKFNNVVIHEKSPGVISFVATFASSQASNISIKLKDSSGAPCGEEVVISNVRYLAEKEFVTNCSSGNVEASLGVVAAITDDDNTVLDVYSGSFDVVPVAKDETKSLWSFTNILIGSLLLLLIVGYLIYKNFKHPMNPVSPVNPSTPVSPTPAGGSIASSQSSMSTSQIAVSLLLAFMFSTVNEVNAETFYGMTMGPAGCSSCAPAHVFSGTISTNASSYAPGSQITFSAAFYVERDVEGSGSSDRAELSVGYQSGPVYDGGTWMTSAPTIISTCTGFEVECGVGVNVPFSLSGSRTFTVPSNMSAGSHYIWFRPVIASYPPGANKPAYDNSIYFGTVSFTVAPPAAQSSVQVWFSQ